VASCCHRWGRGWACVGCISGVRHEVWSSTARYFVAVDRTFLTRPFWAECTTSTTRLTGDVGRQSAVRLMPERDGRSYIGHAGWYLGHAAQTSCLLATVIDEFPQGRPSRTESQDGPLKGVSSAVFVGGRCGLGNGHHRPRCTTSSKGRRFSRSMTANGLSEG